MGETARLRLTEAVHELCSAVAEEHPVILVVDDVHLADDASVAVLHLVMRRTQEQPIMVIMTAREAELARSPHAGRLMEARESLALEAVELPPLTDEEMNEVVTALAAEAPVPPAVRRAMLRAAAGIPMLAELLFDDWRTNGERCLALSVGAMTVDAVGQPEPEVYRRVFDRVFRDLSPAARAVVNLAAILGDRLNDLAMYELVDLTLAQTLAGMSELAGLRVLRDGGREVEFRNELFRNYTYLNVPSPLRRALHGLIADRLLRAEANGERVPGLMLAWHCFRAGRPVEAEPYLLRGCGGISPARWHIRSGTRLDVRDGSPIRRMSERGQPASRRGPCKNRIGIATRPGAGSILPRSTVDHSASTLSVCARPRICCRISSSRKQKSFFSAMDVFLLEATRVRLGPMMLEMLE